MFVTTPEVSDAQAKVLLRRRVSNDGKMSGDATVQTTVIGPSGAKAGEVRSSIQIAPERETELTQSISISNPDLWSPERPQLYRAVKRVMKRSTVLDEIVTPFGIRSLSWSTDHGFLLNGKPIKLHGGSVHHDNGPLGAAAFDRAEERKVELLKAAGNNAVRTAHNPPSPAFLDACDRLGLLVIEDSFDAWTKAKVKFDYAQFFDAWWQRDLDSMVLRDRNHPSVVMWGMGNEIPEVWTPAGASGQEAVRLPAFAGYQQADHASVPGRNIHTGSGRRFCNGRYRRVQL